MCIYIHIYIYICISIYRDRESLYIEREIDSCIPIYMHQGHIPTTPEHPKPVEPQVLAVKADQEDRKKRREEEPKGREGVGGREEGGFRV